MPCDNAAGNASIQEYSLLSAINDGHTTFELRGDDEFVVDYDIPVGEIEKRARESRPYSAYPFPGADTLRHGTTGPTDGGTQKGTLRLHCDAQTAISSWRTHALLFPSGS